MQGRNDTVERGANMRSLRLTIVPENMFQSYN